jgi:cellulose synthase (UDP-forming)
VPVTLAGCRGELVDISMGGAAVRVVAGELAGSGPVQLTLPGAAPLTLHVVRAWTTPDGARMVSLRDLRGEWAIYNAMALWLFHTPPGAVPGLPPGVPVAALRGAP